MQLITHCTDSMTTKASLAERCPYFLRLLFLSIWSQLVCSILDVFDVHKKHMKILTVKIRFIICIVNDIGAKTPSLSIFLSCKTIRWPCFLFKKVILSSSVTKYSPPCFVWQALLS